MAVLLPRRESEQVSVWPQMQSRKRKSSAHLRLSGLLLVNAVHRRLSSKPSTLMQCFFDVTNAPERRTPTWPWCLFKAMIQHKNSIKDEDIRTLGQLMFITPNDDMANQQRARGFTWTFSLPFSAVRSYPFAVTTNIQHWTRLRYQTQFSKCKLPCDDRKSNSDRLDNRFQRLSCWDKKWDPRMKLPKPLQRPSPWWVQRKC